MEADWFINAKLSDVLTSFASSVCLQEMLACTSSVLPTVKQRIKHMVLSYHLPCSGYHRLCAPLALVFLTLCGLRSLLKLVWGSAKRPESPTAWSLTSLSLKILHLKIKEDHKF